MKLIFFKYLTFSHFKVKNNKIKLYDLIQVELSLYGFHLLKNELENLFKLSSFINK